MTSRAGVSSPAATRRRTRPLGYVLARLALYAALLLGAAAMAFPLVWMVITSFQSRQESLQAQPVWWPQRLRPANWAAALELGTQGGSAAWGGLAPGRSVRLELSARAGPGANGALAATVPGGVAADPLLLFGSGDAAADPRRVTVSSPRRGGDRVAWTITLENAGTEAYLKAPLRVSLPEGYADPRSTLPPDVVGRDDAGAVLEWSNVSPGLLGYLLENYRDALRAAPFGRYFLNSLFTAGAQTLLGLVVVTLAAFAFARIEFLGREVAFAAILSSLVIPGEMLLIPNYVTLARLEWLDSYQGLVVPWIASVFGIFLLRQFFLALPSELFEAARMDGAGYGTMLALVGLPLARPGLVTYSIFSFLGAWNALLWPLIVTSSDEMRTLQVGLQAFVGEAGTEYGQLMAASLMVISPIVVGFFFAQKAFIAGVARSGLK